MSISFGNTGIKPYVGSKEVKEAYVGSQLVYRATPPYVYAFLGGETDYTIASWCTLSSLNAVIAKETGIYRLTFTSSSRDNYGYVTLNMSGISGKKLSFIAKTNYASGVNVLLKIGSSTTYPLAGKNDYNLITADIPDGTTTIQIGMAYPGGGSSSARLYIDAVKIE